MLFGLLLMFDDDFVLRTLCRFASKILPLSSGLFDINDDDFLRFASLFVVLI